MTATASAKSDQGAEAQDDASKPDVIMIRTDVPPEDISERVPVFSLDGTAYTMRTRLRPNERLQYTHLRWKNGAGVAQDFVMDALLGDGWRALLEYPALTDEIVQTVISAATRIMSEAQEDSGQQTPAKGRGKKARSR